VRASASGRAEIVSFVTTLNTALDLRSLPTGAYRLEMRRQGEDWHVYPATVK
jgi:hypothetical protein